MDFLTTQTGYEFVYRKGVLNTGEKVTLELKEATAEQVLDALLKSRGYDYEIVDQVVVIRKGAAVYAPEIPRHVRVLQAEPHLQGLRDAAAGPSGKQDRLSCTDRSGDERQIRGKVPAPGGSGVREVLCRICG